MSAREATVTCPLCGTRYGEAEGRACHGACPLRPRCRRLRCPVCGHELPAPTRLTRWLARRLGAAVGDD